MIRSDTGARVIRADFDLRQLEVFCKVVELGSVSGAAEAVHLTQSSVSERMGTLEKTIGARLFDRIGRRNVLTSTGKMLYDHALKHLALKEETIQALEGCQGVMKGEICIGGSTIPGECILPGIIKRFNDMYPKILIRLRIKDTAEIAAGVANGSLTFGLVGAVGELEQMKYTPIWKDELVLIASADHAFAGRESIKIQELVSEPFILREAGSGTRQLLEQNISQAMGGKRVVLNVVAELGSSAAIKAGVVSGMGISVISKLAVANEISTGKLVALSVKGFDQQRSIHVVRDERRTLSPVSKALLEFLMTTADISE